MYIIPIAWLYVVVLMTVAEATSSNGTILGAAITFLLYGVLPISILMYIMGTPGRKRALRAREMAETAEREATNAVAKNQDALGVEPDKGGLTTAVAVAPIGKEL